MSRLRHPIIPYGWRDALKHVAEGGRVVLMEKGHAECWGGKSGSECLGYMTKRSLALFLKHGGRLWSYEETVWRHPKFEW